jgi:photosystem II stability/assembly factor-like uncharacterized protein
MNERVLVATQAEIACLGGDGIAIAEGLEGHRPTAMSADPWVADRAWCCTRSGGVFRSDDGGATWYFSGLEGENLMTVVASPARADLIWGGAEPSAVWRSDDAGATWQSRAALAELPSSSEWAFPPRPETHHVRWVACHPTAAGTLWVAIEAGALISSRDGGLTWRDRVPGGPFDTHELAIHPRAADVLRSSAGDGYFESRDGGESWFSPMEGLDVGYLRSVAIDPGNPEIVVVSAATHPYSAYVAGRSDGRLYRREGDGRWERITAGWPDPPSTIAPLLTVARAAGEFWAADERGVHRSLDGGIGWEQIGGFENTPNHLRALVLVG